MRDPYDPWADEQAHLAELAQAQDLDAIRTCTYCDHQGIRPNGLTCRHIDHAAAAQRGLATIRAQMGWNQPPGTTTPEPPQKSRHGATSSQKTRM